MNKIQIDSLLINIIKTFIPETNKNDSLNIINKYLHIIISQSQQAITFISCIEDEFNIEIDDDDIVVENLVDFQKLSAIIGKTLAQVN